MVRPVQHIIRGKSDHKYVAWFSVYDGCFTRRSYNPFLETSKTLLPLMVPVGFSDFGTLHCSIETSSSTCGGFGICLDVQYVQRHLPCECRRARLQYRHSDFRCLSLGVLCGNRYGYASAYAVLSSAFCTGTLNWATRLRGGKRYENHQCSFAIQAILWHTVLMLTCLAVLYPTLWVIKMAVTPSQAFTMSPNPW